MSGETPWWKPAPGVWLGVWLVFGVCGTTGVVIRLWHSRVLGLIVFGILIAATFGVMELWDRISGYKRK